MRRSGGRFKGGIVIHHSLTADGKMLENTPFITKHHIEVNGWDDNGYHYIVEFVDGIVQIMTGRPIQYQGAHCPPNDSIGICVIGNFDIAPPSTELMIWLNRLVTGLLLTYGMKADDVHYHSEYSHKSCPGKMFPKTQFKLAVMREFAICQSLAPQLQSVHS